MIKHLLVMFFVGLLSILFVLSILSGIASTVLIVWDWKPEFSMNMLLTSVVIFFGSLVGLMFVDVLED